MIYVHGSFVPHGPEGFFFLWAMDSRAEIPAAKRRALAPHPQVLPAERLYRLLRGVPYVTALTCVVPVPEARGLVPAKFTGVGLSVVNAVQWMLDLDATFAGLPGVRPGQSLKAWSAAAKLQVELLGRGRFLPMLRAEAGVLTAGWRLAAPEPDDAHRLAQVEAAIPDVCRAIVPPDRNYKTYRTPTVGALLGRFLRTAADAMARYFLADSPMPPAPGAAPSVAQFWLQGLTGGGRRDLPAGLRGAGELYAALDAWAAPVSEVRGHGALRTGMRLTPPEETEHGGWEVELLLQTETDPPATVPARAAWEAIGGELEIGGQRYDRAEQRILADLPAMARLWQPLEPLRFSGAPSRLQVDDQAVVSLLQEGAHLLTQAGFPVMLPAGLVRSAALRASMHLKPASAAPSQFGLSQLVNVDWELALGGVEIGYDELKNLADQKRELVQYKGQWVQVDQRLLVKALSNLEKYREPVELGAALRLASGTAPGGAQDEKPLKIEKASSEGWVSDLLGKLTEPARMEPVPVPRSFQGELRPYQQRGLDWLAFLRRYGMGACLADDMGLGKTVQIIALLLHERAEGWTDQPTLLVCPVSLVGNWRRELARFAPGLKVLVHHGAGRAADDSFAAAAAGHHVVITTYALAARDEADLAAVDWAGIVADEAQNLKNPGTQHARALRRLRGGYRIALTGTPVENHLGDLWSIFSFLNPGYLGGQEDFRRGFALPVERYHDEEAAARLKGLVQPFILRRMKTDASIIKDLPDKLEMGVYVGLSVEQAALYEAIVQETLERANDAVGIQRHGAVLAGLTKLKQACDHPACLTGDSLPLDGRSGKLERMTEMLEEVVEQGDRALIFTQFAKFGARLQQYLADRFGCEVLFLDGSLSARERDRLVERFQAGEAPIFVLSLKAGGVGLNLTAANHVFHFDRWWNPAVEDQATDRAFRIGQTQGVLVHKLITAGTLEEKIDKLLTEKRALSAQVIGSGEGWIGNLTTDELRRLILLEREG